MKLITVACSGIIVVGSALQATNIIDTVLVGDAGNPADSTGLGQVNYDYYIGTYEVTNTQYAAFLNAVASTDPYELYDTLMSSDPAGGIDRTGSSGSYTYTTKVGFDNMPVIAVSFWDAARFTNWLTSGTTETGVYSLGGVTNPVNSEVTRDTTAWVNGGVAVASQNEWYKAAFYSGTPDGADGDGYWLYPTQSNSIPSGSDINYNANDGNEPDAITDVGYSLASHYGTFDQAGNVGEWTDSIGNINERFFWGGSYVSPSVSIDSSGAPDFIPSARFSNGGFRVTSLEPIGPPPEVEPQPLPQPEISLAPRLDFETDDGQEYSIRASDTVDGTYTEIGAVTGDGTTKTFVDLRELSAEQFYRIELLP